MIRVIGTRGSGKTTKLLNLAAENGYVIVEPNAMMADYVRRMATEKGLDVNVITVPELLYRQYGVVREKYLVDELEMFMASLGIVGYSDGPLGSKSNNWEIDKINIPKDGSICDIILSDDKKGLGMLCAIIKNRRFMIGDMDITDKVLKWHKMPNVIVDSNDILQWDNSN